MALDGVNLRVEKGEYFCILGPSGCGKSTLLKIVAGIVRQDEGDVYIRGVNVNEVSVEERRLALVFQDIYLFTNMDVWENIVYSPKVRLQPADKLRSLGRELVDSLSLKLRAHLSPAELSLGLQQKVAVARALASGSDILLLDEPLGRLDEVSAVELRNELRGLVKKLGLTAIHVTHSQEEAMAVADRIAVMRKGRVEQVGTPVELYFSPASPFVARFIGGETNFLEGLASRQNGFLEVKAGPFSFKVSGEKPVGRVVVAVRPEHIRVGGRRGVEGRIVERRFLGKYVRLVVEVDGVSLVVKAGGRVKRLNTGDKVLVDISGMDVRVFRYPEEGLEEAIRYE